MMAWEPSALLLLPAVCLVAFALLGTLPNGGRSAGPANYAGSSLTFRSWAVARTFEETEKRPTAQQKTHRHTVFEARQKTEECTHKDQCIRRIERATLERRSAVERRVERVSREGETRSPQQ